MNVPMFVFIPNRAAAAMVLITVEQPCMSRCIVSMDPVGFRFKPPVSKVIPLPTKAVTSSAFEASPVYLFADSNRNEEKSSEVRCVCALSRICGRRRRSEAIEMKEDCCDCIDDMRRSPICDGRTKANIHTYCMWASIVYKEWHKWWLMQFGESRQV